MDGNRRDFALIILDPDRRTIVEGDKIARLTPGEFRLIEILEKAKGRLQTKDNLIARFYGLDEPRHPWETIQVHLCLIRRKLRKKGMRNPIDTIKGHGIRWDADKKFTPS